VEEMTYYQTQVLKLNDEIYPKIHLTQQLIHAKHFIEHNFSKKINLNDLAGEAFISKFHFLRLFKSYYGVTPFQYLASVRIENAKRLLKSNTTISQTSLAIGFESVTHFAGLFKKMIGLTPKAFNKKSNIAEDSFQINADFYAWRIL
jgi:AraC-like DNA-binding protein